MLSAHLIVVAEWMSAVANRVPNPVCAEAIRLEADPQTVRQLRSLLRQGSLASLETESCHEYAATLTPTEGGGWMVSMTSDSSSRRFARQVTTLQHAATWIEAWTQSGFVPNGEEAERVRTPTTEPPLPTPVAPPAAAAVASPPSSRVMLGAGPVAAVTSRGESLLGGALRTGLPSGHSPWFGAELGLLAEPNLSGGNYRRVFWAGPMLGACVALGQHWRLQPAASFGVVGVATRNASFAGQAAALYAGLEGAIAVDLSKHWSVFAGIEARGFVASWFGTSTPSITTTKIDDGEVETDTVSTAPANVGPVWGALRLGVTWTFGEPS